MNTYSVAVILDMARPFDRKILAGVGAYRQEAGNWSIYLESEPRQRLPDFHIWQGHGILANLSDARVARAVRDSQLPFVAVGGPYLAGAAIDDAPCVSSDNEAIGRVGFSHLWDQGYRRVAFCGIPNTNANRWSEERLVAFAKLARSHGCHCATFRGRFQSARKWRELQAELAAWLKTLEPPIGVMACNDARARHVLEACRTLGIRVPQDIAVVGVDNDEILCELTDPPLSSVQQGVHRVGYRAAVLLAALMRGERPAITQERVAPDSVVVRRSTGALMCDDEDVAAAVRLIREKALEKIRVIDVARAVGLSASRIQRRFTSAVGRTIHHEIERLRLEAACKFLRETAWPLKQVAANTGFVSVQYLANVFRRRFKQTPSEYRRAAWPQAGAKRERKS